MVEQWVLLTVRSVVVPLIKRVLTAVINTASYTHVYNMYIHVHQDLVVKNELPLQETITYI